MARVVSIYYEVCSKNCYYQSRRVLGQLTLLREKRLLATSPSFARQLQMARPVYAVVGLHSKRECASAIHLATQTQEGKNWPLLACVRGHLVKIGVAINIIATY